MTEDVDNLAIDNTCRRELSEQLVALRIASDKNQQDMADMFGVSLRKYQRWESEGPAGLSWRQWDLLFEEAEKAVTRHHKKEVLNELQNILDFGKHLKTFISFLKMKTKQKGSR